jgi:hypothetical protein
MSPGVIIDAIDWTNRPNPESVETNPTFSSTPSGK